MGFFSMFKKKEEIQVDDPFKNNPTFMQQQAPQGMPHTDPLADINSGLNLDSLSNPSKMQFDSFGNPKRERNFEAEFNPSPQMPSAGNDLSKDMQIVIAKLDAIKAEVNNIDHRLEMIEKQQQNSTQRRYSW